MADLTTDSSALAYLTVVATDACPSAALTTSMSPQARQTRLAIECRGR